jgi:hypothetical protein
MQKLPTLVPGRVFALTSPWTFSAGISSVGYLEQAAPDKVTLVGEAVGDRMRFWAEGDAIVLPNSQAAMLMATERHDYLTGCKGYPDCHGNVVRNPIAVPDLDPDIAAPWTIEAWRAGRDPGMEAVATALRGRPKMSGARSHYLYIGPPPRRAQPPGIGSSNLRTFTPS